MYYIITNTHNKREEILSYFFGSLSRAIHYSIPERKLYNMKNQKWYRVILKLLATSGILLIIFFSDRYIKSSIPDTLTFGAGTEQHIDLNVPVLGTFDSKYIDSEVYVDLAKTINIRGQKEGNYKIKFKLFGLFDIKDIDVNIVDTKEVMPLGMQTGIYVETSGVLVVGTGEITDYLGNVCEPARNKLKKGDYIISADGINVYTKAELVKLINESEQDSMVLKVRRNDENIEVMLERIEDIKGIYKLGIWVRDDTQGIGTLTYMDSNANFGALGHGISDVDTGELLEIEKGELYKTNIFSVIKGKIGVPGELVGKVMYGDSNYLGIIRNNTELGIFGTLDNRAVNELKEQSICDYMPVGYAYEIKNGQAKVICCIDDVISEYDIDIQKVDINDKGNKGIVFKVTDDRLIEKTGGIVQGLSGSPIIQNGKMIGAVTHVFVSDPTKGYGIFIENMLRGSVE